MFNRHRQSIPSRLQRTDFPDRPGGDGRRGQAGQQYFNDDSGNPWLGVGWAMSAYDAGYLEAFPLESTERTLACSATA